MSTITKPQINKLVAEQQEMKKEISYLRKIVDYYVADELTPNKIVQYEKISKKLDRSIPAVTLKSISAIKKYFAVR